MLLAPPVARVAPTHCYRARPRPHNCKSLAAPLQPLPAAHRRVRRPPGRLAPPSPERAAAAAPGWPTVGVSESHFVLGCPGMSAPVFKVYYEGEVSDRTPIAQRPAVSGAANARRANKAARGRAGAGPGVLRPAALCADRWIMDDGLLAAAPVDGLEDYPLQFDVDWLWPGLGLQSQGGLRDWLGTGTAVRGELRDWLGTGTAVSRRAT